MNILPLLALAAAVNAAAEVTVPLPGGRSCVAPMIPPSTHMSRLSTHYYTDPKFDWSKYKKMRCLVGAGGVVSLVPDDHSTDEFDPTKNRTVLVKVGNTWDVIFIAKGVVRPGTPGYKYWTDSTGYTPDESLKDMIYDDKMGYWYANSHNGYDASAHPDSQSRFLAWFKAGRPNKDAGGCVLDVRGERITWNGKVYCDGKIPGGPGKAPETAQKCEWDYKTYCFLEDTPGDPGYGKTGTIKVAMGAGECKTAPESGFEKYKENIYWKDLKGKCSSGHEIMTHSGIEEALGNW
jgi:hypothetical protein